MYIKEIHNSIRTIEDIIIKHSKFGILVLDWPIDIFIRPIKFISAGFREMMVPMVKMSVAYLLGVFLLPFTPPELLIGIHPAIPIAIIFLASILVGPFSTPSTYSTININKELIDSAVKVMRENNAERHLTALNYSIDEMMKYSQARARKWIGLTAIMWSLYVITMVTGKEKLTELDKDFAFFLFGACLVVLSVTWAYLKSVNKLVAILRLCEASFLDDIQEKNLNELRESV